MFKIFSGIKTQNITPAIIEGWQRRYGNKLSVLEVDNLKGYVREPTEKEVKQIVQKLTSSGQQISETKYLKKVFELCWLGGDKELQNSNTIIEKFKEIWQTS